MQCVYKDPNQLMQSRLVSEEAKACELHCVPCEHDCACCLGVSMILAVTVSSGAVFFE